MGQINDITKELAKKFSGLSLDEPKPEPKVDLSDIDPDRRRSLPPSPSAQSGGPKIFPSDRMSLRSTAGNVARPKRAAVLISSFSDSDLEWMFNTPCKRGWEFKTWLEVIGLPPDLHEQHDASIYNYAARAFLNRKREAHQR